MKRAANLRSVEWHEPAYEPDCAPTLSADCAPTLDNPERDSSFFADEEAESGVHARATRPVPHSDVFDAAQDIDDAAQDEGVDLEQVGPYRLIERIGSGAMGFVYRAEHTLLGRVVAIKMLRPELTQDEACVRRFLAEARAVNLIAHDHIIDVTDFACTESGQPWFVMEMLEGSDLALAATEQPFTLARALGVTRQLCEALAAVHTAGIVHRDVKPENVFLQQRDGRDYVTLLDFGIARLPDPSSPDPLQEGLVGTPHYMAPEQISASPIDHRADLYAVGSMLFELVAGIGNTPFRAPNLQKQLMDVLMQPAPLLSSRASVPVVVRDRLDRLVDRCLAKQPSERPASAREIAVELGAIAEQLEADVSAPSETPTLTLSAGDAATPSSSLALLAIESPSGYPLQSRCFDAVEAPRSSSASVVPVEVLETRRRARRELRARRAWSSRGATVLSAAAAALAMWVATSETSWAHAFSRVAALGGDEALVEPIHVAQPASVELHPGHEERFQGPEESFANAHVAVSTGGIGSSAPMLTSVAQPALSEGDDDVTPQADLVEQAEERELKKARDRRAERRARRAVRAEARAAREAEAEPALVIRPASESEPSTAVDLPPAPPVVDRDLVLNPFAE